MKTITVFLIGLLLSLVSIFVLANIIEQGDTNAVGMYFVVFLIPILLLVLLNSLYIRMISVLTSKTLKIVLSFVPVIGLGLLTIGDLEIQGVDGNLNFAVKVGVVALGVTNLAWIFSVLKREIV